MPIPSVDPGLASSLLRAQEYRDRGIEIGEGTRVYDRVTIDTIGGAHLARVGANCVLYGCIILVHDASTNRVLGITDSITKPVVIEDDCFIGWDSIVLMGVNIGRNSIIMPGAIVARDVPAGSILEGSPAKVVGATDVLVEERRNMLKQHPEYFKNALTNTARRPSIIRRILNRLRKKVIMDPLLIAEEYRKQGWSIGKDAEIYPNVVFETGSKDYITIGRNCVLTGCTILVQDFSTSRAIGTSKSIVKPVIIEDGCFVGVHALINMGVRIGSNSIIGAGAVVTEDVPPGSVVTGNPARIVASTADLVQNRRELARLHPEYFRMLPK